jgi:predicted nucleotidyltransferase
VTLPPLHRAFLERALPVFQSDARLAGVGVGGSFLTGEMDEHSDLDLVVVSPPETSREVLRDGSAIAQRLGPLLAAFPGDHVGEPRLLICLYGPPLLHVDLKFMSTDEFLHRVEDPTVLWDRDGALRSAMSRSTAEYPPPRLQWIEDRFWVWVHYIAVKINRGELFEAIDGLAFVRAKVLGSLALLQAGARPSGMRRVEQRVPERVSALRSTLSRHDRTSCRDALVATVELYTELREQLAPPTLVRRSEAEHAVQSFLARADGNRGA